MRRPLILSSIALSATMLLCSPVFAQGAPPADDPADEVVIADWRLVPVPPTMSPGLDDEIVVACLRLPTLADLSKERWNEVHRRFDGQGVMATFPKITNPCPYKGPLSDILDAADVCRLCHRQVHDLSAMSEVRRLAFLKACSGETCVTYRLPARAAALALAAGLMATQAAAAEPASEPETLSIQGSRDLQEVIVTGGIRPSTVYLDSPPIEVVTLDSLGHLFGQAHADAAKLRWDETHRRRDSGKARREKG
eukprot:gene13449-13226_t